MSDFNVEEYTNEFPSDIDELTISYTKVNLERFHLVDLSRFTQLMKFTCVQCNLYQLPPMPPTLMILDCSYNNIHQLPTLPDDLTFLRCIYNELTTLPKLPSGLKILSCIENHLTTITNLPESLEELYCCDNLITFIDALPQNLTHMKCSNNELTCLPLLPAKLEYLRCDNNYITHIPYFPDTLKFIEFSNNQIELLPQPPPSLSYLVCDGNPICQIIDEYERHGVIVNKINILYKFRYLFYSLKLKTKFRRWLWERIREPKIKSSFSPQNISNNLLKLSSIDDCDEDMDGLITQLVNNIENVNPL